MSRKEKVQELIRQEMGQILQEELHDPRIGFVTITRVEMTDDLRYAKIYYSVLGTPKQEKDTVIAMNSAIGFIRKLIAERIDLRFAPQIILKLDKSVEKAIEIENILQGLKHESKKSNRGNKSK